MDGASALVVRDEPTEAVDPGEGALDDPPVSAQLLAGLDAAACNAGSDPATAAGLSATRVIIHFRRFTGHDTEVERCLLCSSDL